jgi:hypothetical protein
MSKYATSTKTVNPVPGRAATLAFEETLETLRRAQTRLAELVERMNTAMQELVAAEGAYTCLNCGRYTTESIEIEGWSEEMGTETSMGCPNCVSCPF